MAKSCISLSGSKACPAFSSSSISTDSTLTGLFPFLSGVTDTKNFDSSILHYVAHGYVQEKYQTLFGCSNVNLGHTNDLYARYTLSFLCNAVIQNSKKPCGLSPAQSRPLCATSCADFVLSEQTIVSSPQLCGPHGPNALKQLRADFTDCALPPTSLSGDCVYAYENEPDNCGFEGNMQGLCSFCRASTKNSTDSCCITSNSESICRNVHLPTYTSMPTLSFTATGSSSSHSTSTAVASGPNTHSSSSSLSSSSGLTGGQIAGIVIGGLVGAILILGLLIFCCIYLRRRRQREERSSLNQPTPPRTGQPVPQPPPRFEALPGARVTRMTALEGSPMSSNNQAQSTNGLDTSPESVAGAAAAVPKRNGAGVDGSSPESAGLTSGEEGGGESEQLASFKDYYSSDEIHTGDLVSTLWAYQPRAEDEFELERGDMLRIIGIWDDGWATGVRVSQRADEWTSPRGSQRDSVVSNGSGNENSPPTNGEVKAFPLVCVCLPQHWRKTIEGDATDLPSE